MAGCLTLIARLIVDSIIVRVVETLLKRITVDGIISLIVKILALFGIRIRPSIS
jgi:hypothetical protein